MPEAATVATVIYLSHSTTPPETLAVLQTAVLAGLGTRCEAFESIRLFGRAWVHTACALPLWEWWD